MNETKRLLRALTREIELIEACELEDAENEYRGPRQKINIERLPYGKLTREDRMNLHGEFLLLKGMFQSHADQHGYDNDKNYESFTHAIDARVQLVKTAKINEARNKHIEDKRDLTAAPFGRLSWEAKTTVERSLVSLKEAFTELHRVCVIERTEAEKARALSEQAPLEADWNKDNKLPEVNRRYVEVKEANDKLRAERRLREEAVVERAQELGHRLTPLMRVELQDLARGKPDVTDKDIRDTLSPFYDRRLEKAVEEFQKRTSPENRRATKEESPERLERDRGQKQHTNEDIEHER